MKRLLMFVVLAGGLFLLSGCGNEKIEGILEDLMTKVYADIPEDERPSLMNITIDNENIAGFLGTEDIEYEEALASEPMISAIAHSVILLRTKDGADVEKIKTTISENIDPRKWVCVGVDKEDVIIKNRGDLVIVIVVEDEEIRTKLDKAFDEL